MVLLAWRVSSCSAREQDTIFIVRMSYVELYNNRFRNLLDGSAGGGDGGDGGSDGLGDAIGFGSSMGSGRGSWRECRNGEVCLCFVFVCVLYRRRLVLLAIVWCRFVRRYTATGSVEQ